MTIQEDHILELYPITMISIAARRLKYSKLYRAPLKIRAGFLNLNTPKEGESKQKSMPIP